jgi:hypothetical protein
MSIDYITVSTTDKDNSLSKKLTDKTDEDKTYQSRVRTLGAITNQDWHKPVVTNTSINKLNNYTNECYVTAAKLFSPSKKLKLNTCLPSHLNGCTFVKAVKRAWISNA